MRDQMTNGITIHIGMPKSASTFLQESIWKQDERILSCLPGTSNRSFSVPTDEMRPIAVQMGEVLTDIMRLEDHKYDMNHHLFSDVAKSFQESNRFKLISNEGLACANYAPYAWNSRSIIATRLASLFPKAKILIIIRNQKEFFPSWFVQMKNTGQNLTRQHTFIEMLEDQIELEKMGISSLWGLCDYDELYSAYAKAFGAESVHVIPYELLKDNAQEFMYRVNDIVGLAGNQQTNDTDKASSVVVNARHSRLSMWVKKMGRKHPSVKQVIPDLAKEALLKIAALSPKAQPTITTAHEQFLNIRYAKGNKWLSEKCGLDLSIYKYPGL